MGRQRFALVDTADFTDLSRHWWSFTRGYAVRSESGSAVFMHRQILGLDAGQAVDHVNGNRLDNRRCNLRVATQAQNMANLGLSDRNTSGFKGVSWNKRDRRWQATISINNKARNLGYYELDVDAAHAYDAAARVLRGAFARLNFPRLGERGVR